jgi:drug/metabolite transporter (DMT)-like permease
VLSVGLALTSAAMYGLSDFLGGLVARRAEVLAVAVVTQVAGLLVIGSLTMLVPAEPELPDVLWGALAGIGTGTGTAFLYRGLSTSRMGVVAPLSAVGAALLPVVVGFLTGDRPPALTWVGIACAVPAIWLVSSSADPAGSGSDRLGAGVVDGLLAGLAFGLMFVALGQVPNTAGLGPLAAAELVAIVAIIAFAAIARQPWVPRERFAWWGVLVGVLAAGGALCFLFASQAGMLTVAAVLSSLYPAFTVLLAATLLHERIHASQAVGLGLAAIAVALIALA